MNLNRHLESLGLSKSDLPSLPDARAAWAAIRVRHGFAPNGENVNLLAEGANVKIAKNEVRTWTLTLIPSDLSGAYNTCTWATRACRAACVMWTAGRQYFSVRQGRLVRTAFLAENPGAFLAILTDEVRRREAKGVPFGLRLNVASDLRWENIAPWLFDGANVRAYDYTKAPERPNVPANYRITFSHSERWTDDRILATVATGANVAMVFDRPKHDLPRTHLGIRVIDGDKSDYRYGDPQGVIVGLAAKGAAKGTGETGGFVAPSEVPVTLGRAA
jgi:hypothetical protein